MSYKLSIAIAFVIGVLVSSGIAQEIDTTTNGIVQPAIQNSISSQAITVENELFRQTELVQPTLEFEDAIGLTDQNVDTRQTLLEREQRELRQQESTRSRGEYTPEELMAQYMSESSSETVLGTSGAVSALKLQADVGSAGKQREWVAATSIGASKSAVSRKGGVVSVSQGSSYLHFLPLLFAPIAFYFFYRYFSESKTSASESREGHARANCVEADDTITDQTFTTESITTETRGETHSNSLNLHEESHREFEVDTDEVRATVCEFETEQDSSQFEFDSPDASNVTDCDSIGSESQFDAKAKTTTKPRVELEYETQSVNLDSDLTTNQAELEEVACDASSAGATLLNSDSSDARTEQEVLCSQNETACTKDQSDLSTEQNELIGEQNKPSEISCEIETDDCVTTETSEPSSTSKTIDDLTKIKGIGPASEKLLNEAGIWNFHDLSNAETASLKKILAKGGPKFSELDPQSWSTQAHYASNEDWQGLENWNLHQQADANWNLNQTAPRVQNAKPDVQYSKPADDLTVIRGIGPKTNETLNSQGIEYYSQIAAMTGPEIIELLEKANARTGLNNPQTWPQQARELLGLNEFELENDIVIVKELNEMLESANEVATAKQKQTQKQ